jgi:hypothetical protein
MATRSEHLSLPNSGPPCAWKSYRWIRRLSRAGGPSLPRAAAILVPLSAVTQKSDLWVRLPADLCWSALRAANRRPPPLVQIA